MQSTNEAVSEVLDSVLPGAKVSPTRTERQKLRAHIAKGKSYVFISKQAYVDPNTGVPMISKDGLTARRETPKKLSKAGRRKLEAQKRKDANRAQ